MAILSASQIHLTTKELGLGRINPSISSDCFPKINQLLQRNHDDMNIFFRPIGGHNHTAHAILTIYALGGKAEDLERAFKDNDHQQVPIPPVTPSVVEEMKSEAGFLKFMRIGAQYSNFLKFFEQEIGIKGWKNVLTEYCFTSSAIAKAMFVQLFEGLYHPLIHIGFGIEFDQPAIIAEGLAQAASHIWGNIDGYFARCDEIAQTQPASSTTLQELYHQIRATNKIRTASRFQQGPNRIKDGLMPTAMQELASIGARFHVGQDDLELERGLVETHSCAVYNAVTAQRVGKAAKIDFFSMHTVTSSMFLSLLVKQPWIQNQYKARLIEWKARLDLAWYASIGAPQLDLDMITSYQPILSKEMNWHTLYEATIKTHDDGHVAKFVRALYSAEGEARVLEQRIGKEGVATLPIKGKLWFKAAQMAIDSTMDVALDDKWLMGAGFDPVWMKIANTE